MISGHALRLARPADKQNGKREEEAIQEGR
jgi:hypothetical protein